MPNRSGVRSIDMNQRAKAIGKVRKGNGRGTRSCCMPAAIVAELHENPAALHPAVVAAIVSRISPAARGSEPARGRGLRVAPSTRAIVNRSPPGSSCLSSSDSPALPERYRVERGDERDTETVEAVPRFGDEPAHRAEHDDGAGVVGDVRGVKPRSRARMMAEEFPESVCSFRSGSRRCRRPLSADRPR